MSRMLLSTLLACMILLAGCTVSLGDGGVSVSTSTDSPMSSVAPTSTTTIASTTTEKEQGGTTEETYQDTTTREEESSTTTERSSSTETTSPTQTTTQAIPTTTETKTASTVTETETSVTPSTTQTPVPGETIPGVCEDDSVHIFKEYVSFGDNTSTLFMKLENENPYPVKVTIQSHFGRDSVEGPTGTFVLPSNYSSAGYYEIEIDEDAYEEGYGSISDCQIRPDETPGPTPEPETYYPSE